MRELKLTNSEKSIFIDDEDYNRCIVYNWYVVYDYNYGDTWDKVALSIQTTSHPKILLSRFILNLDKTEKKFVDHRNGDIFNNQKSNLRLATRLQNHANMGKSIYNTSGYKGVFLNKTTRKWYAQVRRNNKKYCLGTFKDKILAAIAHDDFVIEHDGEFARLNFPLYGA